MFLSQNDGTLMNPSLSRSYPIRTFASGATNSMRGAYFLSGEADAIVADIGGTTTDVGALVKGYPRETSTTVNIGGVCTNFRMPDAISIGLGGGSIVSPASNEEIVVGPESVGYQILDKALVFGGETLTATDIAVAAGYEGLGDPSLVGHLDGGMVERCTTRFRTMLSNSVDQMKIGTGDVPLVLVGGGSILISDTIEGTTKTIIPDYADVANAVGAAISQVGVQVEKLVSYDHQNRDDTVAKAMQDVQRMALDAGGDKSSVAVVEVEEVQLAYMPGSCVRLRIRAVADLCTEGIPELHAIGAG
jgi:N-methylhydantoinase A/oxoprolinase/acetone carboxylase beta subunit